MGLIKGIDSSANLTGHLYGNYSFGNIYYELFDKVEGPGGMIEILSEDFQIAGVLDRFPELDVMDVGTGRQSIAMARLGARSVQHFDISANHVQRFQAILRERYADLPVKSECRDLCEIAPPRDAFDFVFLHGIVHHMSDTAKGLRNCARAVRTGGRIWVYFYRSGTFKWFVNQMIRELTDWSEIDMIFASSALVHGGGNYSNHATSRVMDDFFAPFIYLYPPADYIEFMKRLGFDVVGNRFMEKLDNINHDDLHHSASIVFERARELDMDTVDTQELLAPASDVDQLLVTPEIDSRAKESVELFRTVQSLAETNRQPDVLTSLRFALHKIEAPQYYGSPELPPDYSALNEALNCAIKALKATGSAG